MTGALYKTLLAFIRFFGNVLCNMQSPVFPNAVVSPLRETPPIEHMHSPPLLVYASSRTMSHRLAQIHYNS